MSDSNAPHVRVVKRGAHDADYLSYGSSRWVDLVGTREGDAPVVCGLWDIGDLVDAEEEMFAQWDEAKYILTGHSTWRDASTGLQYTAEVGDTIWFPKGSRTVLVNSTNLTAVYVEQTMRPTADVLAGHSTTSQNLGQWLNDLQNRYTSANQLSSQAFARACKSLPGGNTRSVLYHDPFPLTLSHGRGCHVTSVDGREYLDVVSEYTAGLFGHSDVHIQQAVLEAMGKGFNLGSHNEYEVQLAEALQRRFRSIELVRFCNSGTEANLMAIAVAKAYTSRSKILVFSHGYHGGVLSFDEAQNSVNVPHDFVVATFNDVEATERVLDQNIAAILVEPLQSAGGMIPAPAEFLRFLRASADKIGALLIFDEVVTARLDIHGLQGYHQVYPDLTTLGKSIGGGFSIGAFGGRSQIMRRLDPRAPIADNCLHHSGTFNNNLFSMVAGVAADRILTKEKLDKLNALGDLLRNGIQQLFEEFGVSNVSISGFGSLLGVHFAGEKSSELRSAFYFYMLRNGIFIGRRGFMALNFAHEMQHITEVLNSVRSFALAVRSLDDGGHL